MHIMQYQYGTLSGHIANNCPLADITIAMFSLHLAYHLEEELISRETMPAYDPNVLLDWWLTIQLTLSITAQWVTLHSNKFVNFIDQML